ncbi:MAG TPA: LCP family protein [Acidimicrobiales bacterium]|nr:LCP family protein [Acidimicrobiales bacterium]
MSDGAGGEREPRPGNLGGRVRERGERDGPWTTTALAAGPATVAGPYVVQSAVRRAPEGVVGGPGPRDARAGLGAAAATRLHRGPAGEGGDDGSPHPGRTATSERGRSAGRRGGSGGGRDDGPVPGEDGRAPGKRRRSGRQRVVLAALAVVLIVCVSGASVAGYALVKYGSIDRVSDIDIASAPPGEPENFLIVGSDTREGTDDAGEVAGHRSDTIMIARVDPASDRLALLSFPRDLIVTLAGTGERGMINAAYSMENGEQVLIDTIKQNFGIPIHHYVEIDFHGFQQLVDTIGGVSVWIPNAVRDTHSGLFIEQLGCVRLNGDQGLQFARSRYLDYLNDGEWERDPQSDVSRNQRQQIFIERAMAKALSQVRSNPLRMRELVDIGVSTIRLDDQLGVGDIVDLAEGFRDFSADALENYPLPTTPSPTNENRLVLADGEAEPILNVFRGLPPGEVGASAVGVTVLNGTDQEGFARDISGALQEVGFDMREADSVAERPPHSIVRYAPGQENYGMRLARHLTAGADLVEDPAVEPGEVVLVAGADFTTVHDQPTPLDRMPTTTVPGAPATSATTAPAETTTTRPPPPSTTTTAPNGYIVGDPPAGATCE